MGDRDRDQQKALLDAASRLPPDEREAWLEQACEDESMRQTVAGLLIERDDSGDPIAVNFSEGIASLNELPESIGGYRIRGKLGEGGMAVVYEARQENPDRLVAIKVIRGGHFVDETTVKMFQREAHSLARLKHPNIAAIYEAGCTKDGRHFFAMELVQGPTLTEYAKRHDLTTSDRLELFRKICGAIHYAHQRGVIHRDLKPSNILVDATGEPKILDFGLARITDTDVALTMVTTMAGKIQGTLAYMSPEQARGSSDEIDLRTDVYALGVILYELLAGRLPYDVDRASIPEALRVICETEPPSLSTVVQPRLDPDLATIAGKALEKDRERRYSSAAALADDVERYLTSQPVMARPPSAIYQLRKLAARNRGVVGGALATVLVLLAGVVVATSFALREASQRREAQQARRDLEVVAEFQRRSLEQIDAAAMGSRLFRDLERRLASALDSEGATAAERDAVLRSFSDALRRINATDAALGALDGSVLERTERAIDDELTDQPAVYARLQDTLGVTSFELGLYERSETLLRKAISAWARVEGAGSSLATARRHLAMLFVYQGRFDEAEQELQEALATHRTLLGEDHPETVDDLSLLALHRRENRDLGAAERFYDDAIARRESLGQEETEQMLGDLDGLAWVYLETGRLAEAEAMQLDVLERAERVFGTQSNVYMATLNNLAVNYVRQGRYAEAEPLYRRELEASRRRLGTEHRETHVSITNLGRLYLRMERFEEAASVLDESVRVGRRVLEPTEFGMGIALESYGLSLVRLKRYDEAEAPLLEAWKILRPIVGDEHRSAGSIAGALTEIYRERGDTASAALWAERAPTGG